MGENRISMALSVEQCLALICTAARLEGPALKQGGVDAL
jgi:hypothetical protein